MAKTDDQKPEIGALAVVKGHPDEGKVVHVHFSAGVQEHELLRNLVGLSLTKAVKWLKLNKWEIVSNSTQTAHPAHKKYGKKYSLVFFKFVPEIHSNEPTIG